jgi:hypothetical protein
MQSSLNDIIRLLSSDTTANSSNTSRPTPVASGIEGNGSAATTASLGQTDPRVIMSPSPRGPHRYSGVTTSPLVTVRHVTFANPDGSNDLSSSPNRYPAGDPLRDLGDQKQIPGSDRHHDGLASSRVLQAWQQNLYTSLPPSRAGSEGPGDVLALEEMANPLGVMSNMAGLVEAAVQRGKGQESEAVPARGSKRPATGDRHCSGEDAALGPAMAKRPRKSSPAKLAASVGHARNKNDGAPVFVDPVSAGAISEDEGRDLLAMYVSTFLDGRVDVSQLLFGLLGFRELLRPARGRLALVSRESC